jgi:putative ABC transport system permease protein
MTSLAFLDPIRQDIRYALRTMLRKPAFAAMAVVTLALAIGGNTAMFTIIHAVLLKPLQYSAPDRLVRISGGATPTRFTEMKTAARSFSQLVAVTETESIALSTGAEPEVLRGIRVSGGFLRIPDVRPMLGRSFLPEEDSPGGPPVAMISYNLWQRRFAGDSRCVASEL